MEECTPLLRLLSGGPVSDKTQAFPYHVIRDRLPVECLVSLPDPNIISAVNTDGAMADNVNGSDTLIKAALPFQKRVLYGLAVHALQYFVVGPAMLARRLRNRLFPSGTLPTLTKTYPCRPRLPLRLFFPKSYDRSSPRQLPVLLSIHGGGFLVGDPSDNDTWNSLFANQHTALVVALNYAKSPANPYPGPRLDIEALIAAVLQDPELTPHMDRSKVGITGFSAGGNLALTASLSPAVRDQITGGCVPIYPVTDFSLKSAEKTATRRYKPALSGMRGATTDFLLPMAPIFDWSYINVGQDLRDPLLSPYFAERESFPKRMWIIGCELDLLGHEAWRLACKLAGREVPGLDEPIGQQDLVEGGKPGVLVAQGDQRYAFEEKSRFGEVKWLCVPDAGHGFDVAEQMRADAVTVQDGQLKRDQLIKMTGEWLFRDQK